MACKTKSIYLLSGLLQKMFSTLGLKSCVKSSCSHGPPFVLPGTACDSQGGAIAEDLQNREPSQTPGDAAGGLDVRSGGARPMAG